MAIQAPRLPLRAWSRLARGALTGLGLWLAASVTATAQDIRSARFTDPTTHYAHGVLGDAVEYRGLEVRLRGGRTLSWRFVPGTHVFEDLAPRLWDVTGDGKPEIVVIETDPPQGAQLAIYGIRDRSIVKIAATPHIGRTNRWLAPLGAADLDGDGAVEIAYIDRPHLAKTLRIWRFENGNLTEVAHRTGLTNHRIGQDFIQGGIRSCPGRPPEIVAANADWSAIVAITFDGQTTATRRLGRFDGPASLAAAVAACD